MWAACCNWLCVDTEPDEFPQTARSHDRSSQNVRTSPPRLEATCKACGTGLGSTEKNPCMDCRNDFCSTCVRCTDNGPPLCLVCQTINSTSFIPEELFRLRVKDLLDYLSRRGVPTDMCREKEELVELVLSLRQVSSSDVTNPAFSQNQNSQTTGSSPIQPEQDVPTTDEGASASRDWSPGAENYQPEDGYESDSEVLVAGRKASLSDIRKVEDIEFFSVRQLKQILARNFVDYKGCCEKWELMERVTRLYNNRKELRQKQAALADKEGNFSHAGDDHICKVCMDSPIDCVLLECGHMVTCTKCGMRMNECPICRQYVVRAVHVFRS